MSRRNALTQISNLKTTEMYKKQCTSLAENVFSFSNLLEDEKVKFIGNNTTLSGMLFDVNGKSGVEVHNFIFTGCSESVILWDGKDGVIVPMDNEGCAKDLAEFILDKQKQEHIIEYLKAHDYGNVGEVEKIYEIIEEKITNKL